MPYDFNREWLIKKFEEIRRRILKALHQLNDEQVNWQPHNTSHSIATLIKHIEGNILERINKGILHQEVQRDRDLELKQAYISRSQLEHIIQDRFEFIIHTIKHISDTKLETEAIR